MDNGLCEQCKENGVQQAATWQIRGQGPGCGSAGCCGWEELACDAHKETALTAMPSPWNLTAYPYP
jgi:hypothetical protein